MKFLFIYFPINDAGGIDTWTSNLRDGLRLIGHEVDVSYATLGSGMQKLDPSKYTRMGGKIRGDDRLPATLISYGTEQGIKDYINKTASYDIVLFVQPGPHDIKAYNDPDMSWLRLYSDSNAPTISSFHDDSWKRTNAWAREIPDCCEGILFAQYMFYMYGMADDGLPCDGSDTFVSWVPFPSVPENDVGLYDDHKITDPRRTGVCLSQWAKWKNHFALLPQLEDVDTFQLDVYGTARMQYYYQRKEDYWGYVIGYDAVTDTVYSPHLPHRIMGYTPYSKVPGILQRASFAVDASTKGRENAAMIEAMGYGAISLITEEVLDASDYQQLNEELVVAAPLDELVLAAEEICLDFDAYMEVREAGIEYVYRRHTLEGVSEYVAMMAEAIIDGETGLHPEGLEEWAK